MSAASPQPMIGRCSAQSRSFLLGPCGPAGAPPGQRLRSGVTWQLRRSADQQDQSNQSVHTFRGTPSAGVAARFGLEHWCLCRGCEGDFESECLQLPDVVTGLAVGVDAAGVVAGAEVVVADIGIG